MIALSNFPNLSVNDVQKVEQIQLLIIQAIDDLEQIARSRELTDLIWDVNNTESEQNWSKTSVLLESYEDKRDRSLKSALSTLREISEMIQEESLTVNSSNDVDEDHDENNDLDLINIDENINLELVAIDAI